MMVKKFFIIAFWFTLFFSGCAMMRGKVYIDENIGAYAIKKIGLITMVEGHTNQKGDFGYNITVTENVDELFPAIWVVFNAYPSYSVQFLPG